MMIEMSWLNYSMVMLGIGCMFRGISEREPGMLIFGMLMAVGGGFWI